MRGNPKASPTKPVTEKCAGGQGNDLGYGKNGEDDNNGQSAAKR